MEFALVLPVLLALMVGTISLGFYLNAYLTVAQATRVGVRQAAVGYPSGLSSGTCLQSAASGTICNAIDSQISLGAGMSPANLSSVCIFATSGSNGQLGTVEVAVDYRYTPVIPLPFLADPMQLTQTYTMVQEELPPPDQVYPTSCP